MLQCLIVTKCTHIEKRDINRTSSVFFFFFSLVILAIFSPAVPVNRMIVIKNHIDKAYIT